MNITVTKNQVSVNTDYILNDKEYNVNQCYFTFSDEYTDDLVKKAIFVQGTSTIEMSIINNQCQIPAEVLNNGQFELRVYAYEVDGDELLLRYSPSYTTAYVRTGSYIENAESPEVITPTQFEQYMQAMNDGLNEVANVDIDAEQLDDGMSVTITNRYGEDKTVYAYDGEKGETGATPNIQIGTVVTGDHSEVTRTGTNENPIFNFVLEKGDKGDTGNGIASVTKTSTSGLTDTYTITYTNGTTTTFDVTNGKSITNIAKTSTSGLEDTYTITYNDNTTSTFIVTNGNGISSIEKTGTQDNVDTYTIYYTNGTSSTFTVTNSTVTNQEFEELKAEHEELVNTLPRVEGTGESITLDNTEQYKMNVALSGNTSQTTYTGKNLFDINGTKTDYRVLITIENNKLTQQNRSNGGYCRSMWEIDNLIVGEQYTLSCNYINNNSCSLRLDIYNSTNETLIISSNVVTNTSGQLVLTFTATETSHYLRFYSNTTNTANTYFVTFENIQLEKNSTVTSYEPYVGGVPSPNPLYPQPIKKVTGDNTITVCGKNLLNSQNWAGGYIDSSGNLHTGNTNALFDGYIEVNSNTQYVISTNTSIINVAISEFDSSQMFIQRNQSGNNVSLLTITTTANTKYVRVQFNYDNSTTITQAIIDGLELQLESGSSRSSYEPYQSQTYPINLGSLEYCKIGNYQDTIFQNIPDNPLYNNTLTEGSWYKYSTVGKYILPSNVGGYNTSNNWFYIGLSNFPNIATSGSLLSNYFSNISLVQNPNSNGINRNSTTHIIIRNTALTSADEYKAWLSNNETIMYATLATPTYTQITDTTLIEQLNNLYNQIKSYKGQTNITQTNAELPFNIDASALYDLNNLISRVATLETEV